MIYEVPIIGDGKSPQTAFRPDLTGLDITNYSVSIETDEMGKPISTACIVTANDQ